MATKKIGILGGMGPEATAYYYTQLIQRMNVRTDQEHMHVVIEANPRIPDRTKGILGLGESPLPALLESVERLNRAGVDQVFITCFTSHYYFDAMQKQAQFKLIHAIDALAQYLKQSKIHKVGLLATSGTIKTELFQKALLGIEVLVPNPVHQEELVMNAIYHPDFGIKSGHHEGLALQQLIEASNLLIDQGAELIIGGCTEIGMVLAHHPLAVPMLDPILLVIDELIRKHKEAL